ncbi:hypothetical protein PRZ48_000920 [Zasmidium cellare]|uniref:Uncharacterized protein n=1 Tax=Zasmidium cellare TaxID=395010 RepID=A0ABR0F1G2_ZASCE|nr:hypothetical protein PRZ48_000920 [Zasmidium cellare]
MESLGLWDPSWTYTGASFPFPGGPGSELSTITISATDQTTPAPTTQTPTTTSYIACSTQFADPDRGVPAYCVCDGVTATFNVENGVDCAYTTVPTATTSISTPAPTTPAPTTSYIACSTQQEDPDLGIPGYCVCDGVTAAFSVVSGIECAYTTVRGVTRIIVPASTSVSTEEQVFTYYGSSVTEVCTIFGGHGNAACATVTGSGAVYSSPPPPPPPPPAPSDANFGIFQSTDYIVLNDG